MKKPLPAAAEVAAPASAPEWLHRLLSAESLLPPAGEAANDPQLVADTPVLLPLGESDLGLNHLVRGMSSADTHSPASLRLLDGLRRNPRPDRTSIRTDAINFEYEA